MDVKQAVQSSVPVRLGGLGDEDVKDEYSRADESEDGREHELNKLQLKGKQWIARLWRQGWRGSIMLV